MRTNPYGLSTSPTTHNSGSQSSEQEKVSLGVIQILKDSEKALSDAMTSEEFLHSMEKTTVVTQFMLEQIKAQREKIKLIQRNIQQGRM